MKFVRRKPAVFQAIQYTGENKEAILSFMGSDKLPIPFIDNYLIKDKDGNMEVMDEEEFKKEFESC
jgi:hypothetical protein